MTIPALVLGGGGARGAYEVGVLRYLFHDLGPRVGKPVRFDILVGCSVGSIHVASLAAGASDPRAAVLRLERTWTKLTLASILEVGPVRTLRLVRSLWSRPWETPTPREVRAVAPSLIDSAALGRQLLSTVHWPSIGRQVRTGRLGALAVACTDLSSGRTMVFIQQGPSLASWTQDPNFVSVPARIGPRHVLASCAIPVLFPPVRIGARLYVDGGLRLSVPFSPALRLGADRVAAVALRTLSEHELSAPMETSPTGPFLAGKVLNAVFLESIEQDFDRLSRLNALLEAGTEQFGASFSACLNHALQSRRAAPLRRIDTLLMRPSRELGSVAAEYVRSPAFRQGPRSLARNSLLAVAEREEIHRADLTSYFLFDGGFAQRLIELGAQDARAREADWVRFFEASPAQGAPEAT